MSDPVVVLDGVSRAFDGTPPVQALQPTQFIINPNEYVAIIGPSGSGKSTLLHLLGLLDAPSEGVYYLNGINTGELSEARRAGMRAKNIGFVFQSFHLLSQRTNVENVMLAEVYKPDSNNGRKQRAIEALEQVGLGHRLQTYPTTLSGGERQRVAIARALVGGPSLLLADEPTGNLDSQTGEQILELFDDLHNDGLTIAMITHDSEVAARAQRCVGIRDGIVTELSVQNG